ncbi:hypothetical protein [Shimia sp. NS0008-38b]|uniref:hypothetical protein n=1 Tax=Shimia sp. NS0008-38b TaxID=3127653 RepID=UPI00334053A1
MQKLEAPDSCVDGKNTGTSLSVEALQTSVRLYAELVTFLIAVLTFLGLFYKAVNALRDSWISYRRRRNIKGLLIAPTVEEIAEYSVQQRQNVDPEEQFLRKQMRELSRHLATASHMVGQRRIFAISMMFIVSFLVLGVMYTKELVFASGNSNRDLL